MASRLDEQAVRLHRVANELVMKFQFRDRNELVCYGVTVSQCYTLEALEHGPLTMGALAARLHVADSTMTRIVDRLVARGLVQRQGDTKDRRVLGIGLTESGAKLLQQIQSELVGSHREILEQLPEEAREHVIETIQHLSRAVDQWRTRHRPGKQPQ